MGLAPRRGFICDKNRGQTLTVSIFVRIGTRIFRPRKVPNEVKNFFAAALRVDSGCERAVFVQKSSDGSMQANLYYVFISARIRSES